MPIQQPSPPLQASADPNQLLREQDAALLLGFSVRALQNWRVRGGGYARRSRCLARGFLRLADQATQRTQL